MPNSEKRPVLGDVLLRNPRTLRRVLVLAICLAFALQGSYIIGPTGPSPITPSLGTPTFVQAKEAHTTLTPTSLAVSFTALPIVGDIVIVFGANGADGDTSNGLTLSVTDNQGSGNGNGYARLQMNPFTTGSQPRASLWCAPVVVSSGTFTITETAGSNLVPGIMALEYSGTSCNLDRWAQAVGSTSPYSCGSITTNNPKDLILAAITAGGSTGLITFTAPASFTIRESQTNSVLGVVGAIADNIVSAVNTFTPTWGTGQNHTLTPCSVVALLSR